MTRAFLSPDAKAKSEGCLRSAGVLHAADDGNRHRQHAPSFVRRCLKSYGVFIFRFIVWHFQEPSINSYENDDL